MAKIDRPILLEIVRIVSAQASVPEYVSVQKRRFSITYLDDHRQRIEQALRRQDTDRLNMLFGQLESKIKYQLIREPRAAAPANKKLAPVRPPAAKPAAKTGKSLAPRAAAAKPAAAKKAKAPKSPSKAAESARGRTTPAKATSPAKKKSVAAPAKTSSRTASRGKIAARKSSKRDRPGAAKSKSSRVR